jgi:hypothetical protein
MVLGALAWPAVASAAPPPPPEDIPAASAYVELIPTSGGSRSPRVGRGGIVRLPANVEAQLAREGGADAPLLKEVATSRAYGAPKAVRPVDTPPPSDQKALTAGIGVVSDGSSRRVALLGALLVVMTLGVVGAAVYRRRLTP